MKFNIKFDKKYSVLLLSVIFLIIIINLVNNTKTVYIDIFGKRIKSSEEMLIKKDSEYYLSFDFINQYIDDEIYFDTVSKKVVISSDNKLVKAKINEKNISINFNNKEINNVGVIQEARIYISFEVIQDAYGLEIIESNKTIYVYKINESKCSIKTNKVKMYAENNIKSKVVDYVYKKDKITAITERGDFVLVKVNDKLVGYVHKNMVKYSMNYVEKADYINEPKTYIYVDSNAKNLNNISVNGVFISMFDVTKQSAEISEKNINTKILNEAASKDIKIYGIVSNGYNNAGFNTSTISQILSDETKRLTLINNLEEKSQKYKLDGIVLDFKMIKEEDVNNYIQLIKEFKAISEKEVLLSVDANEYGKYIDLINYSDLTILNAYGIRDLQSAVPGSIAEVGWTEKIIKEIIKKSHVEKLVVTIPAYTILWTEKNSNIIDSDIYSMNAIEEYVSKNNLTKKYNENLKQNYVELEKGSLKYRMWIEDEISIKNRIDIIQKNNINKIAVYKLGYENDVIMEAINEVK